MSLQTISIIRMIYWQTAPLRSPDLRILRQTRMGYLQVCNQCLAPCQQLGGLFGQRWQCTECQRVFTFGKGPLSLFTNTTAMTPGVYEYKRRKLAQSKELNESAQQTQSGSLVSSESAGASGAQSAVGPPKNQAAWKKVWPIVALGLILVGLLLPKNNTSLVRQQNPLAMQAWLIEREVQQQATKRHNEQLAWNKAHPKEAAEHLRKQRALEAQAMRDERAAIAANQRMIDKNNRICVYSL